MLGFPLACFALESWPMKEEEEEEVRRKDFEEKLGTTYSCSTWLFECVDFQ